MSQAKHRGCCIAIWRKVDFFFKEKSFYCLFLFPGLVSCFAIAKISCLYICYVQCHDSVEMVAGFTEIWRLVLSKRCFVLGFDVLVCFLCSYAVLLQIKLL